MKEALIRNLDKSSSKTCFFFNVGYIFLEIVYHVSKGGVNLIMTVRGHS